MTDKTVIPPATAGTINSSIDIEYTNRELEATSELQWVFDSSAYARQTGYDLGKDYPTVLQENGHTLRRVIDLDVSERRDGGHYLHLSEKAVCGLTRIDKAFWTIEGSYTLTENNTVCGSMNDRQPYRIREGDTEVDHYDLPQMTGTYDDLQQAVLHIHNEQHRDGINTIIQEMINRDCPIDAVPINDSHVSPMDEMTNTTKPTASD